MLFTFGSFFFKSAEDSSDGGGHAEAGTGGNASVYLEVVWAGMMRLASVT